MAAPATAQRVCVCARAYCAQCKRQFVSKGVTGRHSPCITKSSSHTCTVCEVRHSCETTQAARGTFHTFFSLVK
eukprot:4799187-Pleurochrysis_carterae.AAC.1